jgi:hypothetical protein
MAQNFTLPPGFFGRLALLVSIRKTLLLNGFRRVIESIYSNLRRTDDAEFDRLKEGGLGSTAVDSLKNRPLSVQPRPFAGIMVRIHSTRLRLAHGRPFDSTERVFLPGGASNALASIERVERGGSLLLRWPYCY